MITTEEQKKQLEQQKEKKKDDETLENDLLKSIDQYDAKFLKYLSNLYSELNGKTMDISRVKNAVDALQEFNSVQQYDYLNNLLYPEKCKGVKIPTPIPVPSCSFQLHNCVTLSTNNKGNLAFIFNPFFLANGSDMQKSESPTSSIDAEWFSSFWYCNSNDLTGSDPTPEWEPLNIGQTIPNVYDQFRLVSASMVVKYIGRLDIASGVIGGAIVFDEYKNVGGKVTVTEGQTGSNIYLKNSNVKKYGNFDLAMDSFYHQENLCLEGLRQLYFPIDSSYEEYTKLVGVTNMVFGSEGSTDFVGKTTDETYQSGFNQLVYVLGAPASTACFKVDIYCNFECLPNASFMNYLPLTLSPIGTSSDDRRRAHLIVQNKPVMKLSETDPKNVISNVMPSIWDRLKKKFNGKMPGIGKLMTQGIINAIPGLKSGFALAGSMLDMQID
jgi:hypothetical protein